MERDEIPKNRKWRDKISYIIINYYFIASILTQIYFKFVVTE